MAVPYRTSSVVVDWDGRFTLSPSYIFGKEQLNNFQYYTRRLTVTVRRLARLYWPLSHIYLFIILLYSAVKRCVCFSRHIFIFPHFSSPAAHDKCLAMSI
jgi:hypothetical protein